MTGILSKNGEEARSELDTDLSLQCTWLSLGMDELRSRRCYMFPEIGEIVKQGYKRHNQPGTHKK